MIGSGNGSPPISTPACRLPDLEGELVAALAEVAQLARASAAGRRPPPRPRAPRGVLALGSQRHGVPPRAGRGRRRRGRCRAGRGCAAPPKSPTNTVATPPSRSPRGSSPWCSNAAVAVAGGLGLRHPELDALERAAVVAGRLLGVGDAAPGGHQVELPGRITCSDPRLSRWRTSPVDQPGDGLQPDVRVRADVEPAVLGDVGRTHVVGEAPGAHGPASTAGERPAYDDLADGRLVAVR